jgi:UDP-N-acetylmuramoylalanine--D-glutamate ligase
MHGKRVTVMGLGRHGGGVAAARWLAEQGCRVTVTDLATADSLAESLEKLRDVAIDRFVLGRHEEADFLSADVVVVNPAVRSGHPLVSAAAARGVTITSEIELFLERCPAMVIGVTGTTGKSTTATMLYEMLRADGRCAWLGGNIGVSLLGGLKQITSGDVVVLELSSFQLAHLSDRVLLPTVAVVTNCSPNHLDWHGTWEAYVASKQRLLAPLRNSIAVLNTEDVEVARWAAKTRRTVLDVVGLEMVRSLKLRGEHNRQNAQLAATIAWHLGVTDAAIEQALENFEGLPHRLEFVSEVDGRAFVNDSKATSPSATVAALKAMERPTWLLAGGVNSAADFVSLVRSITQLAKGTTFYGATAKVLSDLTATVSPEFPTNSASTLNEALDWAFHRSQPGETILLSPACASFDQYRDFEHRGHAFVEQVRQIAARRATGEKSL